MTQSQLEASTSISHRHYNDLSLPAQTKPATLSPEASSECDQPRCRPRRHRRTVSDNSKDRKAGAYVHVKGKRKAPSPPIGETVEVESTIVPSMSTLARKKRQAPAPPTSPTPSTSAMLSPQSPKSFFSQKSPQSPKSPITTVLNGGLFNEAEMAAIMNGQPMPQPSTQTPQTRAFDQTEDLQSTDTLKLERGILRSNRESTVSNPPLSPTKPLEVPSPAKPNSSSPVISPRPWYKRSTSHNKDQSIPFKREITLLTMEKRKTKTSKKDTSPPLPEVSYSRSSSLFDGFFGRSSHQNDDHSEKRRSGIGMPNISELDREAAEIIQKEKENAISRAQADNDKYYDAPPPPPADTLSDIPQAVVLPQERRSSTKDLINRFEETNPIKLTVNSTAFVDNKAERYFPDAAKAISNGENVKNRHFVSSPPTNTNQTASSSSSMVESILGNMQQTTKTASVGTRNSTRQEQQQQPDTTTTIGGTNNSSSSSTTWICSFCTLENYNWRVICEVCERIRPYDRSKAPLAVVEPSLINKPQPRFRYTQKEDAPTSSSVANGTTVIVGKYVESPNNLLSAPLQASAGPLAKSASEHSVYGAMNQRKSSKHIIKSPVLENKKPLSESDNKRASLIDSSSVVTTKPSVFVAPQPARHESSSNSPDLDQMRAVRIAKFSEDKLQRTASEEPPRAVSRTSLSPETNNSPSRKSSLVSEIQVQKAHDKPLLTDRGSLEREKQRLREMIREMNAKALAAQYPIKTQTNENQEVRKNEVSQGAIRKVFTRTSDPPVDKLMTDATNYIKGNNSSNNKGAADKLSLPTTLDIRQTPPSSLLLSPSPIAEINEDDLSPSSPATHAMVDQQIDSIYAKLKTDDEPETTEVGLHRRNTAKGLDDFRATLKKTRNRTNTLALNKILKDLEIAIGEGQHEQAAKLAMDLAKMKVSLSVTKQCQSDDVPTPVSELKLASFSESKDKHVSNIKSNVQIGIKQLIETNGSSDEGATALPDSATDSGTLSFGWTCPLCTLINSPNRPGCVACSETRPASYVVPAAYQAKEPYEMPVEQHKSLNKEVNLRKDKLQTAKECLQPKNDLNRATVNRRSAEIFNIIINKDNSPPKTEQTTTMQTQIVMTSITESPNITKSRYRGVDNYNPHIKKIPTVYKSPLVVNPIVKPVRATKLPVLVGVIPKKTTSHSNPALSQATITPNTNPTTTPTSGNAHYNQLLNLDNTNVVPNAEPFLCPVCLTDIAIGAGVILRECLHTFCRECIVDTVKYSEEAEVKCPYIDEKYSCECVIQEREIRALMTKEAYDVHLAVSLKVAQHRMENAFHCRTPGCKGWCVFEDNDVNQFKCPICRITNCLTCRVRLRVIYTFEF